MFKKTLPYFFLLFGPIVFIVIAADCVIYTLTMAKHTAMTTVAGYRNVEKAKSQIAHELDTALKDLTLLAFIHESYDIYDGNITQDLEDTFMTISYNRRAYDRIRYLDKTGKEIFLINYNEGFPRIAFEESLRDEGDRNYYKDSIDLRLDQLYISPMDTAGNNTSASTPPILHLASPITDTDGINMGVLVLDFLSRPLLNSLAEITEGTDDEIMLLNHQGFCLKGPAKPRNARLVTSKCEREALSATHPDEWAYINGQEHGQFTTGAGLFTFTTVNLATTICNATHLQGAHKAPQWKLVAWTPLEGIEQTSRDLMLKLAGYNGLFLLTAGLLIAAQCIQRARRAAAEALVLRQTESNQRFVPKEFLGLLDKRGLTEIGISDNIQCPMTTLFTDIRSYTRISESMTPRQVLDFLNAYYQVLDPIIQRNGGFIDAFIGDAVMALFPDGADGAVRSAIEIRYALRDLQHKAADGSPLSIKTGFGLHSGEVTLGAVGTDRRMQTTAIGDAVNLAARIESSTKMYGVSVIISGNVRNALPDANRFRTRSIDQVRVKGKQEVVELFEVFDSDPPELLQGKLDTRQIFEDAMRHYREGDFEAATMELKRCKEICPEDTLPDIYIKRCNTMMRIPPGEGWSGVSTL